MTYIKELKANSVDSHQSHPWAIACFLPFKIKDTLHNKKASTGEALAVKKYTVISDILKATVTTSKSGGSSTAELELASGNLNYKAILSNGDHVLIWMHNDKAEFDRISKVVYNLGHANDYNSGLKFVGRVNSVRKIVTFGYDGKKSVRFLVTLQGFKELNTQIYFNPLLQEQNQDFFRFYANITTHWNNFLSKAKDGAFPVGEILDFFIDLFVGKGPDLKAAKALTRSPNEALLIPKEVAILLGMPPAKRAKFNYSYADILQTIIGVQKYSSNSPIPKVKSLYSNHKKTPIALAGKMVSLPDNFTNVTLWSLLDAHKNSTMNEMYVTLRVNEDNKIVPTYIARQIPFNVRYKGDLPVTKYLNLPRWKIDPNITLGGYNIGTTDAVRCNFMQLYGQFAGIQGDPQMNLRQQITDGNFDADLLDIVRYGNRNMVSMSNADVQISSATGVQKTPSNIGKWKEIASEWYMNGHLKENGFLTTAGIPEPICVGDNLEFDNMLFHIETVQHSYVCTEDGFKSFNSTFNLSNGLLTDGSYSFNESVKREDMTSIHPGYSDEEVYVSNKPIVSKGDSNE